MWKRPAVTAFALAVVSLAAFPQRRAELTARAVHETIVIDHLLDSAKHRLNRLRTNVVLGVLSDAAIHRLGQLSYASIAWYRPNEDASWPALFPWEQAFTERYLPDAPASVLVGGAGTGRETYHLAAMGHRVVAFDPLPAFVDIMVQSMPPDLDVRAFRASYGELPYLGPATPGDPGLDLNREPPFDAAILGWCSFSHVLHQADQLRALKTVASVVSGPILISFFSRDPSEEAPVTRSESRFPLRHRDPSYGFQTATGVYRRYIASEIFDLCAAAGLSVVEAIVHKQDSYSSYVIVRRGPFMPDATCLDPVETSPAEATAPRLGA